MEYYIDDQQKKRKEKKLLSVYKHNTRQLYLAPLVIRKTKRKHGSNIWISKQMSTAIYNRFIC